MSSIACLKHLRSAIFKEQAALVAMDTVYCDFIIKLLCYQTGKGPEPSQDEFTDWKNTVASRLEFSRLLELI